MIIAYLRVSTDKQDAENQRFELERFAKINNITIDGWVNETVSGTKKVEKRKLGQALTEMKKGDILLCTEISRIGRSLYDVMGVLHTCMDNEIGVWTTKENYRLGTDMNSAILAFAFSLAASIERDMISQRTRQALAAKKAAGVKLGRPKGALGKNTKLTPYENSIRQLIAEQGNNYSVVARLFHVDRTTLKRFCDNHEIYPPQYKEDGGIIFNMPKINN